MDPIDRPKRPNPLGSHPVNQRRERRRRSTSDIQKLYRTYREFLTTPMSNNLNMFPSFLESSNANNVGAPPRMTPSSAQQQPPNGNGMNGMPMLAGQQMDVNLLYQKVCELSDVLKENREKTQVIVKKAEELAVSLCQCFAIVLSISNLMSSSVSRFIGVVLKSVKSFVY